MDHQQKIAVRTVKDLSRELRLARGSADDQTLGEAVVLLGAGCSASAGVPTGATLARELATETATKLGATVETADAARAWLEEQGEIVRGQPWGELYGVLFEKFFPDAASQRRIVKRAIGRARGINWAHLALGELVAQRFFHTVLTTNFDQLALDGIVRTGILPVVADGIDALSRVDGTPAVPQVVHLHGTLHTYNPLNSRRAVQGTASETGLVRAVVELLRSARLLVVVGYAGAEEGVMEVLSESIRTLKGKTVFWIAHSPKMEDLSSNAIELLAQCPTGGVILGQDADLFFHQLLAGLGIGVPKWMTAPVDHLRAQSAELVAPDETALNAALDEYAQVLDCFANALSERASRRTEREKQTREANDAFLKDAHGTVVEKLEPMAAQLDVNELSMLLESASKLGRLELVLQVADLLVPLLQGQDDGNRRRKCALVVVAAVWRRMVPMTVEQARRARVLLMREEVVCKELGDGEVARLLVTATAICDAVIARVEGDVEALRRAIGTISSAQYAEEGEAHARKRHSELTVAWKWLVDHTKADDDVTAAFAAFEEAMRSEEVLANIVTNAAIKGNYAQLLVRFGKSEDHLERAAELYRSLLSVFTRSADPQQWAFTQSNLARVSRMLWDATKDVAHLRAAVDARRRSLEWYNEKNEPRRALVARFELATDLALLMSQQAADNLCEVVTEELAVALLLADRLGDEKRARSALMFLGALAGELRFVRLPARTVAEWTRRFIGLEVAEPPLPPEEFAIWAGGAANLASVSLRQTRRIKGVVEAIEAISKLTSQAEWANEPPAIARAVEAARLRLELMRAIGERADKRAEEVCDELTKWLESAADETPELRKDPWQFLVQCEVVRAKALVAQRVANKEDVTPIQLCYDEWYHLTQRNGPQAEAEKASLLQMDLDWVSTLAASEP